MQTLNESSCIMQAQWEWNDNAKSGRWGSEFQAYRPRPAIVYDPNTGSVSYGYSVITSRSKIRGKGRAISFKFRTERGKACHILGWNLEVRSNKEPGV